MRQHQGYSTSTRSERVKLGSCCRRSPRLCTGGRPDLYRTPSTQHVTNITTGSTFQQQEERIRSSPPGLRFDHSTVTSGFRNESL
ncbi:unnamed protein product [Pleuronectes platessa]|uniref:Uncharacterized protein n=1 Tax=Pleuronectes platessa TaxID=8262 RepID=A0A9N7V3L2_PLEPL|nr:unnamed protein product [Pleuronectes platessa]